MKHPATIALILGLGITSVYAEERPVRMRFSGSLVPTSIVMQPNTITDEELTSTQPAARREEREEQVIGEGLDTRARSKPSSASHRHTPVAR